MFNCINNIHLWVTVEETVTPTLFYLKADGNLITKLGPLAWQNFPWCLILMSCLNPRSYYPQKVLLFPILMGIFNTEDILFLFGFSLVTIWMKINEFSSSHFFLKPFWKLKNISTFSKTPFNMHHIAQVLFGLSTQVSCSFSKFQIFGILQ